MDLNEEIKELKQKEELKLSIMGLMNKLMDNKILDFRLELVKFNHKVNFDLLTRDSTGLRELANNKNVDALFSILNQLNQVYDDIVSGDTNENGQ